LSCINALENAVVDRLRRRVAVKLKVLRSLLRWAIERRAILRSADMERNEGAMTCHDSGSTWFLAQMKPNCVSIADRNLTRQGFRTFLPTEEVTRERQGKFVTAQRPLFPGYIFLSFDIAEGHWRKVNSTSGITRLVSFGKEPATVPLGLVSQLMLRCDASGRLLPPRLLKPGDQVTLTTGPFARFVGEVEKIAPDRRIWVLLDIMGGQTRVAVSARELRAI
jgi:transcriptional antiterminator RfaH